MRNAFAEEVTLLANEDKRIVMLPADIGNRLFDKYKEKFPDRFYNCGVAEADTLGIAAGIKVIFLPSSTNKSGSLPNFGFLFCTTKYCREELAALFLESFA